MEVLKNQFFGHERHLQEITQSVLDNPPGSFSLVGSKLVGKSKMLEYLSSVDGPLLNPAMESMRPAPFRDAYRVIVLRIDCSWQDVQDDLLGVTYSRLEKLLCDENYSVDWAELEGNDSASKRIWMIARQLNRDDGYRIVLLYDNFDKVFRSQVLNPDKLNEMRPLTTELAMVVATEQPLHDLDSELAASPLFNVMTQHFIGLINKDSALRWLQLYAESYPIISEMSDELLVSTGTHPYLLYRISDILSEMQAILQSGVTDSEIFPHINLRLGEHGRLLFATQWRVLQNPPRSISSESVMDILHHLLQNPLPLSKVRRDQMSTVNWLLNQAILKVGPDGYQLFSPLLNGFIAARLKEMNRPMHNQIPSAVYDKVGIYQDLTKIESALLRYFEVNSNQVIAPEQLLADVWKRPDASTRRVQEAIRRLRLQLDEIEPPIGVIENDRGRGYRYVPA